MAETSIEWSTRVLRSDLAWVPARSLKAGDAVVTFTGSAVGGANRVFSEATILAVEEFRGAAVAVRVGGRSATVGPSFPFLAPHRPYDRPADQLSLRSRIVDVGMPALVPDVSGEPYLAGYLAGAVAGDGTMRIAGSGKNGTLQSYMRVAVLASDAPLLARVIAGMEAIGCEEITQPRAFDGGAGGFVPLNGARPMLKVETRRMGNLLRIRDRAIAERDDPSWKAGWLAGFLDTDGSHSGNNLRFNQTKPNGHLDATHRYIGDLGFASDREDFRSAGGRSERLIGRVEDKVRFLAAIRPALERKSADFLGRRFPATTTSAVDGVVRVGECDLVNVTTSTGTILVEGLAAWCGSCPAEVAPVPGCATPIREPVLTTTEHHGYARHL